MKSSKMLRVGLGALLSLAGLIGCGTPPSGGDGGGNDVVTQPDTMVGADAGPEAGPGPDASPDARPDAAPDASGPNVLYTRCTMNSDCGTGGTCITSFPGGLCTRRCTGSGTTGAAMCRGPNGETGACGSGTGFGATGNVCIPTCTQPATGDPGLECENLGTAARCQTGGMETGVCVPSCYPTGATAPAGAPRCNTGLTCDPLFQMAPGNGACVMTPSTTGMPNGSPCMTPDDCRSGICIPEVSMAGNNTGWIGGTCISLSRQPTNAELNAAVNRPLPQSTCPMGSVSYPVDVDGGEAWCLQSCMSAATCRPGYICDRLTLRNGMPAFTVGGCVPGNCRAAAGSAGAVTCPSGYACVDVMQDPLPDGGTPAPRGRCEASGTPTDGGTPSDAARPDGATTTDGSAGSDASTSTDGGSAADASATG